MLNSKDVAFMANIKVIIRLVDDNDCAIGHHRRNGSMVALPEGDPERLQGDHCDWALVWSVDGTLSCISEPQYTVNPPTLQMKTTKHK